MSSLINHIGVGCCFFLPQKDSESIQFTGGEYLDMVRELLETHESIDNINFHHADSFLDEEFFIGEDLQERDLAMFMCGNSLFEISFDITIPNNTLKPSKPELNTDVRVTVVIKYLYYSVVTLFIADVGCIVPPFGLTLNTKSYLVDGLNESSSSLHLQTIGPTPFHCDFYFYRGLNGEKISIGDGLYCEYTKDYYNDTVNIYYDEELYRSDCEALYGICDVLGYQLELYYYAVHNNNKYIREWIGAYNECVEISHSDTKIYQFLNTIKQSDSLNRLMTQALEIEIDYKQAKSTVLSKIEENQRRFHIIFKNRILNEIDGESSYDIAVLKQYILSLKEWRDQRFGWLINAAVALSAGLVGALATWVLSLNASH
ncbi:hypothetical protein [Pseudodesulfovibrio karagichevae]|uniref:Uncharacterized protein n=1 Tax=Pseudodesulfovibrio karagichevae TaxID=3239305 RepID=A0ABV4K8F3_9BACT